MKRAILILILCAVFLSACGNAAETAERSVSVDTSAVSQTTTAVTVSAVTSAKEEKDTSEATTTTFKTSSQTVSETSKPTNTHSNYDQEIRSIRLFGKFQSGTEQFCTE